MQVKYFLETLFFSVLHLGCIFLKNGNLNLFHSFFSLMHSFVGAIYAHLDKLSGGCQQVVTAEASNHLYSRQVMTVIQWSLCDCKSSQHLAQGCPRPRLLALVIPWTRLGQQKGGVALRSLVSRSSFSERSPTTLGCACPQSWRIIPGRTSGTAVVPLLFFLWASKQWGSSRQLHSH